MEERVHPVLCVLRAMVYSVDELLPTVVIFRDKDEEFQTCTSVSWVHAVCTPASTCRVIVLCVGSNVSDSGEVYIEAAIFAQLNLVP